MKGIKIKHVSFGYKRNEKILDNLDLEIPKGSFFGITGINGSGKTTFTYLLNGLIPQEIQGNFNGDVFIDGVNTRTQSISFFSSQVGLVFQNPDQMLFNLTVFEEVAFGLKNLKQQNIIARVKEALQSVGLEKFEDRDPQSLSFGQKQKLCLACVLAMNSQYIVLDEVTSMLDYKSTIQLYEILVNLQKQGKTIIIVEHDTDWLLKYCNTVAILQQGKTKLFGNPKKVFLQDKILNDLGIKNPLIK